MPDAEYLKQLEDGIVEAAQASVANAKPATLEMGVAKCTGVGTNRRDPAGPSIPQVPVLVARDLNDGTVFCVNIVCSMHPTVLHEDSTLVSGDFPGLTRRYLQQQIVGTDCPIVYHMGAAGNQSPRHVTKSNTFEEAERLGTLLGEAVVRAMENAEPIEEVTLSCGFRNIDPPLRQFPAEADAQTRLNTVKQHLDDLRNSGAPQAQVRTAECDWFGARQTLTLAQAFAQGVLKDAADACKPVEIFILRLGDWAFVGWPGEVFVEFAHEIMKKHEKTFVITLVNSSMLGYLVTAEAVTEGGYEASNALFKSPDTGRMFVDTSLELLA